MSDKFFEVKFLYSPVGVIRCKADGVKEATEMAAEVIGEKGFVISSIVSVEEVQTLYPEGMEPEAEDEAKPQEDKKVLN